MELDTWRLSPRGLRQQIDCLIVEVERCPKMI